MPPGACPVAINAAFVALSGMTMQAFAADPPRVPRRRRSTATRCARAATTRTTTKPIFAIYQTRHGVKADPRTPSCQSCHGVSDDHPPAPRAAFHRVPSPKSCSARGMHRRPTPKTSRAWRATRPACACTGRAASTRRRDLVCSNCHQGPCRRATRSLRRSRSPRSASSCHKTSVRRFTGFRRIRSLPADGLLRLPQSAWLDRPEAAGQELRQRDLLHLPCGEARPVPVGTRAGRRRLHELPYAARLDERAAAEGARARLCQECHSGDHGRVNSGANCQGQRDDGERIACRRRIRARARR